MTLKHPGLGLGLSIPDVVDFQEELVSQDKEMTIAPEGLKPSVFAVLTFQPLEGVESEGKTTMVIHELAQQTGVPSKTIRYYESIGLLPRPERMSNNYRQYAPTDVERLRFIASARTLGFSLEDILEILGARDNGMAPCRRVLDATPALRAGACVGQRLNEIDRRIADWLALRDSLQQLQSEGAMLPLDDVRGEHCICYLIKTYHDTGHVTIQKGEFSND